MGDGGAAALEARPYVVKVSHEELIRDGMVKDGGVVKGQRKLIIVPDDGTEPQVNTRVKMGQTSNVIALVKADGKFYYASKEVKVTLGGCGG